MLKSVDFKNVHLLPGLFRERYDINRNYLLSLSNQGLLQNFYLEAGIIIPGLQVIPKPEEAELHWGWDAPTCQLRGHFLGHWLSAAAMICSQEKDYELKAKLDTIIDELLKCQGLNGGEWIGPIPEKYFDKLELGKDIWSPQYVMHKLLLGLTHAYIYLDNKVAFEIIDNLSNWYIKWTDAMLVRKPRAIYKGEESGMLEVWGTLYEITRDEKYLTLAKRYSEPSIFRDLLNKKDALTNCHTNASIPWSHGAIKLFEITGEEQYKNITEEFWKCAVTDRGTYCTGGQSAGEFWIPPFQLGRFMSDRNQEFCTVYNLVRTANSLFKWSNDTKYADFIELCLYNGFLAQQNKVTGMPTYFLPMIAGGKKLWGSPKHDFWCCYGTMVQAQAIYNEYIYFECDNKLVVSQYIPSQINWYNDGSEVIIKQTTNMKYYNDLALFDEKDDSQSSRWSLKFEVVSKDKKEFTMSFRVPKWIKDKPTITINGETINDFEIENNYIEIRRVWDNDEITLFLPPKITTSKLPDLEKNFAILEGPIVLAALSDIERVIDADIENIEDSLSPQYEHTYEIFPWKQSCYRTKNQIENFDFIPLYEVTEERYTIYNRVK